MTCEKCKVNQATVHMKQTVNGVSREVKLCGNCAAGGGISLSFGSLSDFMMANPTATTSTRTAKRCHTCSATFDDIVKSGKLGCGQCYTVFAPQLKESLRRIHGDAVYVASTPAPQSSNQNTDIADTLLQLKSQLNTAISAENYEEAVKLRDQIRGLEN